MGRLLRYLTVFLTVALLLVWGAPGGETAKIAVEPRPKTATPAAPAPRSDIRVDTTVVLIPVHVTDPLNVTVTGLEKDNFRVLEGGVEQEILSFNCEDAPVSIGIVF